MYHFELDDLVIEALDGLPHKARVALQEFLTALVFDPWEFRRRADEPRVPLRSLPFGERRLDGGAPGVVTFLVYPRDELVLVVKVLWLG